MKIYGVTGWKNSGKTGLMERLITEFTNRGFAVSSIKHAHHTFDVDHAGKDSHRHRIAGAKEVILASRTRVAVMQELRGADEPTLDALLARITPVATAVSAAVASFSRSSSNIMSNPRKSPVCRGNSCLRGAWLACGDISSLRWATPSFSIGRLQLRLAPPRAWRRRRGGILRNLGAESK